MNSEKNTVEISNEEYVLFVKLRKAYEKQKVEMKRHNKNCISKFFHCKVCNKEMKYKSKHNHIKSKEHLKILVESGSTEEEEDDHTYNVTELLAGVGLTPNTVDAQDVKEFVDSHSWCSGL